MSNMADLYAADLSGADWYKSTYTAGNGNCVEVASTPGVTGTAIRDSKNVQIPAARVSREAWQLFLSSLAKDELQG
ncbi:DUF397 domain-containing protein [Streptomyces sp. PU-14G]|uniref:DUF397 domain-containing protein n=1 Tax=Streptomyces sp. PU-14G TaxID=2800808 RepID=UPI0034DE3FD9